MYKAIKRLRKIEIFSVKVWDLVETKVVLLLPIIVKMIVKPYGYGWRFGGGG